MNALRPASDALCPLCQSAAYVVRELPRAFLAQQLEIYFSTELPDAVEIVDYAMCRCSSCTLEFATPSNPGSTAFYDWLSQRRGYYPKERWEWRVVLDSLRGLADPHPSLIEVGCGDGVFLEQVMGHIKGAEAFGLDTSPKAVSDASRRGATAFVGGVQQFLLEHPERHHRFDAAVSFHCLEHVPDPVDFVRSLLDLVHNDGRVFVSTPYSPMSLEVDWFDPLNHPPHHLTRWSQRSYEELARACQAELQLRMPKCSSAKSRALASNAVNHGGVAMLSSAADQRYQAIVHPLSYLRHLRAQHVRESVNGETVADVVLAEFRPCRK